MQSRAWRSENRDCGWFFWSLWGQDLLWVILGSWGQHLWEVRVSAVLYYISQYSICWDFGGMTIQDLKCVGIDPNCCHPKPRPSTPTDLFGISIVLYQKEFLEWIFLFQQKHWYCLLEWIILASPILSWVRNTSGQLLKDPLIIH